MALMVLVHSISWLAYGGSAKGNQTKLAELKETAEKSMKVSTPKPDALDKDKAELGDHLKDLEDIERQVVDRYWFPCENLFFGKTGEVDRKWRKPKVLVPDEFTA